ncbi:MAG TPA: tRNA lysidine(34) synthetase TilS, partial [Cytophagales bacterium]|nr:tRNA lysidine(34) synthetase TilS [Cytophagales bacterium]
MINELKLHLSKLVEDYTKRKYLLAVSGGMDSVVLAHLFKALELDFTLAHCNFQLRGVDSDADERFVSILSNQLSRNFKVKRFEVDTYIQSHKMSVQMAARTLRYTWFEQLAKEGDYDFIVTAHHKNDLAETMLLNMVKGTGYAGLVGIKSLNNHLLRPLLAFEKSQIEAYANRQGIQWREDSSNSLDKYQRNHLRLHVMPLLKAVNPKVE